MLSESVIEFYSPLNKYLMWLLLLIVLSSEPPHKHKGSIFNLYKTEAECMADMDRAIAALKLKGTKVNASCSYKEDFIN